MFRVKEGPLKAYMVYSKEGGSLEGACLVFAHTRQEARKVAWKECNWEITDEWIDVGVRLLKESLSFLFLSASPEKIEADIAHCISAPPTCKTCERWGEPINTEGYCPDCWDDIMADRLAGITR